jgi:hypothetical protein
MFLLYHCEGCNICEMLLHECYVKDLHTTTCSGMLGHHSWYGAKALTLGWTPGKWERPVGVKYE